MLGGAATGNAVSDREEAGAGLSLQLFRNHVREGLTERHSDSRAEAGHSGSGVCPEALR